MLRKQYFNLLVQSKMQNTTNGDSAIHRLSDRAKAIVPFEVMQIIDRANQLQRQGRDIIHLEVGEPNFPTAPSIVRAVTEFVSNDRVRYTETGGRPDLRQAIAQDYARRFDVEINPDRILVTAGASAALLLAMGAVLNPGQSILMADPAYPCNRQIARFVEARAQLVPATAAEGYQLSERSIREHWSDDCAAALIASPSNPTGTVVSPAELQSIYQAVDERSGHLIVDEIYQGLSYQQAPSTALVHPNAWIINSFSKYAGMTGWRLGWMVCPEGTQQAVTNMAQHLYISPSEVSQVAGLASFEPEAIEEFERRRLQLKAARDYLIPALESLGFRIDATPEGAYYLFVNVTGLADDSVALATRLLEQAGVATTPGHDFGPEYARTHLRIAYVDSIERLAEAVERMADVL